MPFWIPYISELPTKNKAVTLRGKPCLHNWFGQMGKSECAARGGRGHKGITPAWQQLQAATSISLFSQQSFSRKGTLLCILATCKHSLLYLLKLENLFLALTASGILHISFPPQKNSCFSNEVIQSPYKLTHSSLETVFNRKKLLATDKH